MKNNILIVLDYLDKLFPNPQTELVYHKDYELLIAVVLSAQTTDKKVNKVTPILFNKYPSLESLSKANLNDLENILKSVGMYHKKASFVKNIATILHNEYNDKIPNKREELEELSGVGRKSANVILSMLFNEPIIAVDTHVDRVSKRLGWANKKDTPLIIEKKLFKLIPNDKLLHSHYQLVLFGRYHCQAKKPNCLNCEIKSICEYQKKEI